MARKSKDEDVINIEQVGNVLTKTEQFIENNQKILVAAVIGIIVVVGGYLGYKKLYLAPLENEAHQEMFMAEQYFAKDSFNLALNGDNLNAGFLKITEEYSSTSAGNLASYYAGICYLNLGKFEQAVEYLEDFSTEDKLLFPVSQGATGDAYLELGNLDEALSFYRKAADKMPNDFTTPIYLMKAGFVLEKLNRWEEALSTYKRIEKEYNRTNEGRKIEKYITRASLKLNKK